LSELADYRKSRALQCSSKYSETPSCGWVKPKAIQVAPRRKDIAHDLFVSGIGKLRFDGTHRRLGTV
jgi:hypothetical protein